MNAMEVLSFGPYRLYPDSRRVEKEGVSIKLGSRALDILIVLARRSGNLVSAKELLRTVWREAIVSPVVLRVQMNALRKALGDGQNGVRYISNVTGMGYCFVAPIHVTSYTAQQAQVDRAATLRVQELEQRIQELQQMLAQYQGHDGCDARPATVRP